MTVQTALVVLLRCMSPEVAPLRPPDYLRECRFVGVDRKLRAVS